MAQGTSSLSLSGGGAGATNIINSNPQAVASAATLSGSGTGRHRIRATTTKGSTNSSGDSRQIKASIVSAAVSLAGFASGGGTATTAGGAAIGVSTANNQISWDSTNDRSTGAGVSAKLDVSSTNISGGLELSSINADSIEATVASVAVGFAYGTNSQSVAISAAGAGATNSIGTGSAAQITGRRTGTNREL